MKNIHACGALFALSLVIQSTPLQADLNNSIYVPVEPCRVGNSVPTKITAGTSVEWLAYGDDMSAQGGAGSPGCPQPKTGMKPIGVALNVTVVGNQATGNGNVVAYPADGATPSGSLVNYKPGTNIANSTIVGLCQDGVCDGKFKLQSNISDVPVIADVQGYFYPAPGNVTNVAVSGGDYTSPVDAIADVANWCGIPSTTNRCLVKIAPGTYDVGSNQVVMQQWVSIQGSGQEATTITGAVTSGSFAIVDNISISDSTISDLTIENTGGATKSRALYYVTAGSGAPPRLERVIAYASGGSTDNQAVYVSGISPIIINVNATGSGGTQNYGMYIASSSSPTITNVIVTASGGSGINNGMYITSSDPILTDVTTVASGGTTSYGIFNAASSTKMMNVNAKGTGGSSENIGMYLISGTPFVQDSILEGTTYGVKLGTTSRVVNSKIIGVVSDAPSGTQCRGNYDENLADVTC